jgi:hypothetical protein
VLAVAHFCSRQEEQQSAPPVDQVTDYDLKIDEQTEAFLAKKHQLTYFIVTAAVVPIGFALTILNDKMMLDIHLSWGWALLVVGGAFGLLAGGLALLSLWAEISSYQRHIKNRYKRKSPEDLSEKENREWERINSVAGASRTFAFGLLAVEMPLLAVSLIDLITA